MEDMKRNDIDFLMKGETTKLAALVFSQPS